MYIVLGGFLRILGAPSVQFGCTLTISVFVCGRYPDLFAYGKLAVEPGLVFTLPAFMRSIASHPAGLHGRLAQ